MNLNWSNSGQFPGTMQLEGKSAGHRSQALQTEGMPEAWRHGEYVAGMDPVAQEPH